MWRAPLVEEAGGAEELVVLQKPIPLAAARPADDGIVEGELLAPDGRVLHCVTTWSSVPKSR